MFNKIVKSFKWGNHEVTMETGEIARQATGAVLLTMGETVVLATVVVADKPAQGLDYFPLTVDYVEKTYAAGKIPGGYFKREGKPSEYEILTSRLIDRPIRPLFPKEFYNEVHLVVHTLSQDPDVDADIPAIIASSAALSLSGVPFYGPISAVRVGRINEQFVLNPSMSQRVESKLDLVVAGTEDAILMVEAEANELPEDVMLEAIVFGQQQARVVIDTIKELTRDAGRANLDWQAPAVNSSAVELIKNLSQNALKVAYEIRNKAERNKALQDISANVARELVAKGIEVATNEFNKYWFELESEIVRGNILAGEPRIDGRDTRTVRPISIRLAVLPRAHGSALFTRGETQALVVTALGTEKEAQKIESLLGDYQDRFMFHYNMPPFATGEVGRMGSTKEEKWGMGA